MVKPEFISIIVDDREGLTIMFDGLVGLECIGRVENYGIFLQVNGCDGGNCVGKQ